jgi:hypothetical protein
VGEVADVVVQRASIDRLILYMNIDSSMKLATVASFDFSSVHLVQALLMGTFAFPRCRVRDPAHAVYAFRTRIWLRFGCAVDRQARRGGDCNILDFSRVADELLVWSVQHGQT